MQRNVVSIMATKSEFLVLKDELLVALLILVTSLSFGMDFKIPCVHVC